MPLCGTARQRAVIRPGGGVACAQGDPRIQGLDLETRSREAVEPIPGALVIRRCLVARARLDAANAISDFIFKEVSSP